MAIKPRPDYAFDRFPRGEIHIVTPRRKFLSTLLAEASVNRRKTEGHVGRKLCDLGAWPDKSLLCVVPLPSPGSRVDVQGSFVCGTPNGGKPIILFMSDSPAFFVYNLFDGINTLDEIADSLARRTGWTGEKAFAYTRGVFLSLVMLELVQPKW